MGMTPTPYAPLPVMAYLIVNDALSTLVLQNSPSSETHEDGETKAHTGIGDDPHWPSTHSLAVGASR